jgi:acyl-coenzyme A synthetase/AMP-(fatty) acid ligase
MPSSGAPLDRPVDVTDLLRRGLDAGADTPALVSRESRFTWRELEQASDRLAANLLALGLKPGDRVASLMPNRCALELHYIACVKAGLVATPLNYRYMAPEIDHALEVSGASVLIAHAERDRDLAASKLAGRLPRGVIRYGAKDRQAPSFVARTFDPEEVLQLLRTERPTVLYMLPAALFAVVRDHGATREDFTSLRLCRSAGDKIPLELEREFTDLTGHMIDEGYGCTEIGSATTNPPSGTIKIGSVGRANPGYTMSARSEDGTELPPDREGRLWVRSHTNMIGYWSRPDATAEVIKDGWFDTGDLMRTDGEGYFWFCGRKKQIIVHDGSNICPQEVEDALLEHAAVENAGVIGIHDLVHGENVRAYITLKEGVQRPTVQELIRFARARIGYKALEMIFVLDKMPLNPTGKIDRVKLERMAAERSNGVMI